MAGISAYATEFAPVGSKWVRCSKFYHLINQDIFESKAEIEMDGKKVKQIENITINHRTAPDNISKMTPDTTIGYAYAYNVGDSVFYKQQDEFVLLFVYNRNAGDTLNLQWVEGLPGKEYTAVIKDVELQENGAKRYTISYLSPNDEWSPMGDAIFEDGLGVVAYKINGQELSCSVDYPIYAMTVANDNPKLVYTQNQYGLKVYDETIYKELTSVNTVNSEGNTTYYDKVSDKFIIKNNQFVKGELLSIKGELIKSFTSNEFSLANISQHMIIAKLYLNNGSVEIQKIVR